MDISQRPCHHGDPDEFQFWELGAALSKKIIVQQKKSKTMDTKNTFAPFKRDATDAPNKGNSGYVISYLGLRKGIGILGMALPFVLASANMIWLGDLNILPTISDYYYSALHNIFVGSLCAIGVFLFSYKGYNTKDDWAGDVAAVAAICVALFPTAPGSPSSAEEIVGRVHLGAACLFFGALAYFCLRLFTQGEGTPTPKKTLRNQIYRACGGIIIFCIVLIAVVFGFGLQDKLPTLKPVFWLEALAIEAFGFSWIVKGEAIGLLNDEE